MKKEMKRNIFAIVSVLIISIAIIMVSKNKAVQEADIKNVIQILDENGTDDISCTMDKFVEIFDKNGLAGFIM